MFRKNDHSWRDCLLVFPSIHPSDGGDPLYESHLSVPSGSATAVLQICVYHVTEPRKIKSDYVWQNLKGKKGEGLIHEASHLIGGTAVKAVSASNKLGRSI